MKKNPKRNCRPDPEAFQAFGAGSAEFEVRHCMRLER